MRTPGGLEVRQHGVTDTTERMERLKPMEGPKMGEILLCTATSRSVEYSISWWLSEYIERRGVVSRSEPKSRGANQAP